MFIDLVKAFDRVPRELLWDVMLRYGVPPKIVSLLRALHATVHVQFEVGGQRQEGEKTPLNVSSEAGGYIALFGIRRPEPRCGIRK